MGQKVNPKSLRLKINEKWNSIWIDDRSTYGQHLIEDIKLREKIQNELSHAAVVDVIINRDSGKVSVSIFSARPGIIIGKGGTGVEKIKSLIEKATKQKAKVNIVEVKNPDSLAAFIGQSVAFQLEKRFPFRRAIKQAIEKASNTGIKGIKVQVAGRLNGADIARTEKATWGTIPLSTMISGIDYSYTKALTTYGIIGVKVWVYTGEKDIDFAETQEDNRR